jgi:hypothetical protein
VDAAHQAIIPAAASRGEPQRAPLRGEVRGEFLERLRAAGLPE